jgi:isoleucyl-tRNA synthetase
MSDTDNLSKKSEVALREEKILEFWKENRIFQKSLEKEHPKGDFVFYEGPPTANGKPGIHHLESRAFKDVIPRFKTMQGFRVRRKAGWDTHGLPVELEVEKQLGLKSKKEIEQYGIAEFNKKCKESVWKYLEEWERFTDRIAFWVDKDDPYITYKPNYIESVWNIVKNISDKNLLYKDYKVVPWCPRCGTGLSSHELAQGYENVKELSVYVKFKVIGEENTYLLAWTTTPWTLPGNVALAVGKDIEYERVTFSPNIEKFEGGEKIKSTKDNPNRGHSYWLAKNILDRYLGKLEFGKLLDTMVTRTGEVVKGEKLVGLRYEPLYSFMDASLPESEKQKLSNAFKVYPADFVTTADGTGIVHTAVMYGQDDFVLGTKVGLPKHHLVDESGKFIKGTGIFEGRFVKDEDVAVDVIKDLAGRGLLLKKEKYEHSYPHCWRCHTPLIYYARDSWYIRMSGLRQELLKENEKINWEPEHIKDGRFGEWLREVKDWALSRERYWGTPLPIWECDKCDERRIVGSVSDLNLKSGNNQYFVMRHGESLSNKELFNDSGFDKNNHLTQKGREQVLGVVESLRNKNLDLIISSPVLRTKETTEIISKELGVEIVFDDRLKEKSFGDYEGKSLKEYQDFYGHEFDKLDKPLPNGENSNDIRKRMGDFIYDTDSKYQNKNILIVSHGTPIYLLYGVASGFDDKEILNNPNYFNNADVKKLDFKPIPHNELYELDLHRPYIDQVELGCTCGGKMKRVREVMDVWFDSGAMPFAQDHYPFENKEFIDGPGYPADYISEAIDQTRGWFYTLHAIGILMGKGRAFKNVICLGHLMDKDGRKMSKSVGNVVNPWEAMDKYGVDILRFWMFSINQPGESKNYDPKTVEENVRKVINLLDNIFKFYETYAGDVKGDEYGHKNILDQWIVAELNKLIEENTKDLENYKVLEPARRIRDFIGEFSTWYIRRSRDRFKEEGDDKKDAILTTKYILLNLSKLLAPFMPLLSEDLYKKLNGKKESVHLEGWPTSSTNSGLFSRFFGRKDENEVVKMMNLTRAVVSAGLEKRSKQNIKVRQPLSKLVVRANWELPEEFRELIKDEVNIKDVVFEKSETLEFILDTNITPELKQEGQAREFMRFVQDMRKNMNLKPSDVVSLNYYTQSDASFIDLYKNEITKVCGLKDIVRANVEEGEDFILEDVKIKIKLP